MATITIAAHNTFVDGEYQLDLDSRPLTGSEAHIIKEISGVRLVELKEASAAGDYDLFVALAVIVLLRTGRIEKKDIKEVTEVLLEADIGQIIYTEDPDKSPPPLASSASSPDQNESSGFT